MNKKIAVAGTGYVGLSIATLLAQHNHVVAVDIVPEKVELINNRKSPIQDEYIEKYLAEIDLSVDDITGIRDKTSAIFTWYTELLYNEEDSSDIVNSDVNRQV